MNKSFKLSELAVQLGGRVIGPDVDISGLSAIELAVEGELSFAETARYLKQALESACSAVMVGTEPVEPVSKSLLVVSQPKQSFIELLSIFNTRPDHFQGIHTTAFVDQSAQVGQDVSIGAYVSVGADVQLGDGCVVYAGSYIGQGSRLGAGCIVYPNTVIMDGVIIDDRVIIGPGCVIGADGYGYQFNGREHVRIPHIGCVHIESDVELGANVCVDRAKTGTTRIGQGTKIDNQVHIAHNVQIGKMCLIVAQVGIAGSSKLGDGVILAGQVGVSDNLTIGSGAVVGARSTVLKDLEAGGRYLGTPAINQADEMKQIVTAKRMPQILQRLHDLEKKLEELQQS